MCSSNLPAGSRPCPALARVDNNSQPSSGLRTPQHLCKEVGREDRLHTNSTCQLKYILHYIHKHHNNQNKASNWQIVVLMKTLYIRDLHKTLTLGKISFIILLLLVD